MVKHCVKDMSNKFNIQIFLLLFIILFLITPTTSTVGDNSSGNPPPLPPSPVSPLYISENQSLKGGTMIRAKFFQKILPEKSKLPSAPFSKKKFQKNFPEKSKLPSAPFSKKKFPEKNLEI